MHRLANELAKLSAYAGDRDAVTMEDIDAICTKSTEYRVFDLSDAMVKGTAAAASRRRFSRSERRPSHSSRGSPA